MFKNKKAFTLTELIMVIAIMGILMAGMTVYLGGSDEKRKIIEAQGCTSSLLGEMNNYVFYALTSKSLRKSGEIPVSPEFYRITLDGDSALKLGYSTTEDGPMSEFKPLTISNTCRQNSSNLKFERKGGSNITSVKMNKGFSPKNIRENRVFYLSGDEKYLTGDILVSLCTDDDCVFGKSKKQIAKWEFDGRTQTISLKNCMFYNNDNNTCKTREGCKKFKNGEPGTCEKY